MRNDTNRQAVLLLIVILLLTLGTVGCKYGRTGSPPQAGAGAQQPSAPTAPDGDEPVRPQAPPDGGSQPNDKEQVFHVKLAAVGDVLVHSSVYEDAKIPGGYDFQPMFEPVKPYIESADIALANEESMLGGVEIGLSDYPRFNSPYEVGDALKATGFDLVNLANNHTLDRGEQAVTNTIRHLNELGIQYTGAYLSEKDRDRLRLIEKNGISFAFLSYTYGTNGIPVPAGKPYLVNLIDLSRIRKEVAEARQKADVVVVQLHFGQEYVTMPNDEQKRVARAAVEAGAHIVIGHHPHVLQPAEWIETPDGRKSFVVYSLGNFIAAQEGNRERTGGIVQLEIEKTVKDGSAHIRLLNPSFLPTWINMTGWRRYSVVPLRSAEESQLPQADAYVREIENHMKQWMPDLQFPTN